MKIRIENTRTKIVATRRCIRVKILLFIVFYYITIFIYIVMYFVTSYGMLHHVTKVTYFLIVQERKSKYKIKKKKKKY